MVTGGYAHSRMNQGPESDARRSLGNIPLVILCGSLAAIYAIERNWLDGAIWGCLAVAMLLTHGMDFRRPGAWKTPLRFLGIALATLACVAVFARLAMTVLR